MDPIRVLVTGGCGFLGTAIISALLSTKRYVITAIDINPPSLGSSTFTTDVHYVRCDVLNPFSLQKLFSEARPAIVVHTVGVYPLGAKRYSMKGKEAVFKVNVEGTRNVLEASRGCGAKGIVYTSSVTVVLDKLDRDFRNVDEKWPTGDVDTSYGRSKVCRSLFPSNPHWLFEIFNISGASGFTFSPCAALFNRTVTSFPSHHPKLTTLRQPLKISSSSPTHTTLLHVPSAQHPSSVPTIRHASPRFIHASPPAKRPSSSAPEPTSKTLSTSQT
jgi:hypothetical protein